MTSIGFMLFSWLEDFEIGYGYVLLFFAFIFFGLFYPSIISAGYLNFIGHVKHWKTIPNSKLWKVFYFLLEKEIKIWNPKQKVKDLLSDRATHPQTIVLILLVLFFALPPLCAFIYAMIINRLQIWMVFVFAIQIVVYMSVTIVIKIQADKCLKKINNQ